MINYVNFNNKPILLAVLQETLLRKPQDTAGWQLTIFSPNRSKRFLLRIALDDCQCSDLQTGTANEAHTAVLAQHVEPEGMQEEKLRMNECDRD